MYAQQNTKKVDYIKKKVVKTMHNKIAKNYQDMYEVKREESST